MNNITHWILILLISFLCVLILISIFKEIRESLLQDDPMLHQIRLDLQPLFQKNDYTGILSDLNNKNIMDKVALFKGNKSYTINKHKIFICLRDENGEYYDKNMLTYVVLHEIAHCICTEVGHTDLFHKIFEALLEEATQMGIYNPSIPIIDNYCLYNDKE